MVFLPIKPRYAIAIKNRDKKVEFRKAKFKNRETDYCIVYASSPLKKVIGYFRFREIDEGKPSNIWKKYNKIGAIDKKHFYEYFGNRDKAYAIKIEEFFPTETIDPKERIKGFSIPQSFRYLSVEETKLLLGT